MIRRPPRSTLSPSSAASDVYKRQGEHDENSDIDICIKLQEPNYFIILDIKEDLEKILSTKVDVISLGAIMRNFFRKSLEQDAIYI